MDTSETYIKMCEKAEEIQLKHRWQSEDHGIDCVGTPFVYCFACERLIGGPCPEYYRDSVWLPRQDQLQGMLPEFKAKSGFVPSVAQHFADFVCSDKLYPFPFETFEQSWLAYVMFELYHKVWNGQEWIPA